MIHIAKSLAVKLLLLLMLLIVLSALLIGSMRLLTPAAGHFRGELEQWVSQRIQRPVRIGGLSARWRGLGPELVLSAVEIDSPNLAQSTLKLAEIRFSLALLESLRNFEIKTRLITLSRVNLLVSRHPNGTFSISGLDGIDGGGGDSSGLFALPTRIRLEQSDIVFENQLIEGEPLLFRNVNAVLRNAGRRHQLEAELPFPGGGQLVLRADVRGDVSQPGGWNADLYLKGQGIAPSGLLQSRIAQGYSLPSGDLSMEIWSHWEDGRFSRTEGRGDIAQLLIRRVTNRENPALNLEIERLGGSFLWTAQPQGWQLDVRDIQFSRNGAAWPASGISVSARYDDAGKVHLLAGAGFARAGDLGAVAGIFLAENPEIVQALRETAMQGELRDLRFELEEAENQWSVQGNFDSLTTRPWKQFPGVRNLDAKFWFSEERGELLLNGRSTALDFPQLFRDPLELKMLKGQISWSRDAVGNWRLESPDILAVTRDIHTNTRLTLEIPLQQDKSVFMDLQTDFSDGLAINAHRYYPVGIMPEAVVSWLDRGIVDGKVTSGSALVRGPLSDFPFHKSRNGVFEVFFHTENMTIDYAPGWPRLTNVAAEVRFFQNGFEVKVERGKIFDSQLNQTHGRIADFNESPFELKGRVQGALHDGLRLLRESPLAVDFAVFTEQMSALGEAVTLIDLTIPIGPGQEFNLDGALDFGGSTLNLEAWKLPLTDIHGKLNFTQREIRAQGVKAKALGSDITVDINTLSKPIKATRISARAQISSRQLARRFSEIDFGPVTGRSEWSLRLDIPHRFAGVETAPSMLFSSGLIGVSVELPAPLGKIAEQTRQFALGMEFPAGGGISMNVEYGPLLKLALASDSGNGFTRGALRFGGEPARIPAREGLEISGRLESLDLAAWSEVLQSQSANDGSLPFNRLELDVLRMTAGDFALDDVSIDFRRERELLNGRLFSHQAEGSVQIPIDIQRQPVRVRLNRLSLNYQPVSLNKPQAKRSGSTDPVSLPAVDLEVEKTQINGMDYGNLQLISQRIPTGLELQAFTLKGSQLQLSASGSWTRSDTGEQYSQLQLSLTTDSLGSLLDNLGYERYIDRAPGVFDSQLDWADSPEGFRPDILNGRISLQLGKGQFLNVDPGIGRVFGLLNIAALQRRLSLDFSDLVNKGLAFDSVVGNFELDNGDAYTTDFQIKGPSAQVDISGRTGLASEDFDQLITVTPHLSAALPVAGLLAGGPVGGAAMLIAQGLLGKEFDKASKRQYEVKGAWDDPSLTQISAEDSVSISRVEQKLVREKVDAGSGPEIDNIAPSKGAPRFIELLKKQFTPTHQIYPDARDGAIPGGDP